MKKLIALFLCLCLMAGIVPVMAESTAAAQSLTSESFPLYLTVNNIDSGLKKTLWFLDGVKDLPYVEANDVGQLIEDLMGSATGKFTYTSRSEGAVTTVIRERPAEGAIDNGVYATFDFDKDTITFLDHDLFCWKENSTTVLDVTAINTFNADGEPSIFQKVEKKALDRYGDQLVIRCGDYGIDLVERDGKYFVPLQILNDFIFSPGRNQNLFFNGQVLIMSDQMNTANELYYAAPTGQRSAELAEFGYKELCMMLDYCYGLKEAHNIGHFETLLHSVTFDRVLKETDPAGADYAIARLIFDYLDDGHSAFLAPSYLAGPVKYDTSFGTSVTKMFAESERYAAARKVYYPDGIPGYEEVGNTAYITFDSFYTPNVNDMEAYYREEDVNAFPDNDTIGLIMKAHAQITRENSPIENVVLDLSLNEGGMSDTAVFVLAWLLGEADISVENTMTGAMSTASYLADVNRDRKFDEKDTVANKKIFCLTSPYSFSCGNLVPCVLKDSNRATLLGRTSGGGSCMVQFTSSAWGSSFRISQQKRLSFLKNGSFYDIDRGADPDYQISTPEKYYDRKTLTDYINSLY